MITPPPGQSPDDHPPEGQWQPGPPPPPGYPYHPGQPPGYPYYPGPPPPGYPYGPPQPRSRIAIGMVFAGTGAYFAINLVVAFAALAAASSDTKGGNTVLGVAAAMLALIAFGGGAGLLASHNRYAKGLGLGLMIGWALTSLVTVGFCTGINPTMYASS